MLYKTEMHCHSAEVSGCAKDPAEHIVELYLENGYTTLVLTNHFSPGTLKRAGENATWEEQMDFFVGGYEKMKKIAGNRLHVLLGAEFRLWDYPNDYLVYGLTPEFLYAHPELPSLHLGQMSKFCREHGLFLVQAHPFRDGLTVVNAEHVDGIEVYNGTKDTDNRNMFAEMWAAVYGKRMTAGSDHHKPKDPPDAGILTKEPITTMEQLVAVLRSGDYELYRV